MPPATEQGDFLHINANQRTFTRTALVPKGTILFFLIALLENVRNSMSQKLRRVDLLQENRFGSTIKLCVIDVTTNLNRDCVYNREQMAVFVPWDV